MENEDYDMRKLMELLFPYFHPYFLSNPANFTPPESFVPRGSLTKEFFRNFTVVLAVKHFLIRKRWQTFCAISCWKVLHSHEMYIRYIMLSCFQEILLSENIFDKLLIVCALVITFNAETLNKTGVNFYDFSVDVFMVFYKWNLEGQFRRYGGFEQFAEHLHKEYLIWRHHFNEDVDVSDITVAHRAYCWMDTHKDLDKIFGKVSYKSVSITHDDVINSTLSCTLAKEVIATTEINFPSLPSSDELTIRILSNTQRIEVRSEKSEETQVCDSKPEMTADTSIRESPADTSIRESPADESIRESPAHESIRESPAHESIRESPAHESIRESPADESIRESPADESIRESPADESIRESPADFWKRASPAVYAKPASPKKVYSKPATPKKVYWKPTTPKDYSKHSTPKDYSKHTSPKDYSKPTSPKVFSKPISWENNSITVSPEDCWTRVVHSKRVNPAGYSKPASPKKVYLKPATPKKVYLKPATPKKDYSKPTTPKDYSKPTTPKDYSKPTTAKVYSKPTSWANNSITESPEDGWKRVVHSKRVIPAGYSKRASLSDSSNRAIPADSSLKSANPEDSSSKRAGPSDSSKRAGPDGSSKQAIPADHLKHETKGIVEQRSSNYRFIDSVEDSSTLSWCDRIVQTITMYDNSKCLDPDDTNNQILKDASKILEHLKDTITSLIAVLDEYDEE